MCTCVRVCVYVHLLDVDEVRRGDVAWVLALFQKTGSPDVRSRGKTVRLRKSSSRGPIDSRLPPSAIAGDHPLRPSPARRWRWPDRATVAVQRTISCLFVFLWGCRCNLASFSFVLWNARKWIEFIEYFRSLSKNYSSFVPNNKFLSEINYCLSFN